MNVHGPTTGARVRVWGRGARGSPRGGVLRPERHLWRPQERAEGLAGGEGVDAGDRARWSGVAGAGGVARRPYAGEVFSLWGRRGRRRWCARRDGTRDGPARFDRARVNCEVVRSDPVGVRGAVAC